MRKQIFISIVFPFLIIFIVLQSILFGATWKGAHSKDNLPKGCGSCHKGHGVLNTPMLRDEKERMCYGCHGSRGLLGELKQEGFVAKTSAPVDVERAFQKPYHHPIETASIHDYRETLPEVDPSMSRHVSCADCHHHHYVSKKKTYKGVKGISSQGAIVQKVSREYELCFKCHSSSANLPSDQTNKAEMFSISNPSYHPIIRPGKSSNVPSLLTKLDATSLIKCTDCHNNSDPADAKGPHGSEYRHLLAKNFKLEDGPEGRFEYELCYSCHDRNSILTNRSFSHHGHHISVVGVSCRTCHNPHGSQRFTHLIDLNSSPSIRPSSSGNLDFVDFGNKSGQCYLTCHGKDHNPATYPGSSLSTQKKATK
jgi:predicted CXXCH cytochrome family protein